MKKSKFLLVATLVTTMLSSTSVFANQGKMISGRTMIPLRGAFADLGFEVSWDNANNTATLKDENHVIKVKKDDVNFTVDGVSYKSDVAPKMINGTIYIPLRSIGDKIGAKVAWDGDMEIASMFYDEDSSYIYLGTFDKLSKSSYGEEANTVYTLLDYETIIIDEFNEALAYAEEGDFDSAIQMLEIVKDECNYLFVDDFDSLSPSIQENVAFFAAYTVYCADSYIEAIEANIDGDTDTMDEALDYASKYTLMANLYYENLGNFFNATYIK